MTRRGARCYIYGVMSELDRAPDVDEGGLDGEPVRLLHHGGLSAVVGTFSEERVRATRANLSAHERVVDAARRVGTVLPIRFGVLMDCDQDVVEELLKGRRDLLSSLLAEMAGRAEIRIQASYLPDVALRDAVATDPSIVRLRRRLHGRSEAATYYDRIRLGELVAAAVQRVRAYDAASLTRRIDKLAVLTRPLPTRSEHIAMHAAFLFNESDLGEQEALLATLAKEHAKRLRFRVVGPLAPWDFVDVNLDERRAPSGRRPPVSVGGD